MSNYFLIIFIIFIPLNITSYNDVTLNTTLKTIITGGKLARNLLIIWQNLIFQIYYELIIYIYIYIKSYGMLAALSLLIHRELCVSVVGWLGRQYTVR